MTLPISPKLAAEPPKVAAPGNATKGAKDAKSARAPGSGSFASLIAELAPKPDQPAGLPRAHDERADETATTGKILPLDEQALADGKDRQDPDSHDDGEEEAALALAGSLAGAAALARPPIAKLEASVEAAPATPGGAAVKLASADPTSPHHPARTAQDAAVPFRAQPIPQDGTSAKPASAAAAVALVAQAEAKLVKPASDAARPAATFESAKPTGSATRSAGFTVTISAADRAGDPGTLDAGAHHGNAESGSSRQGERSPGQHIAAARLALGEATGGAFELAPAQPFALKPMPTATASVPAANTVPTQTTMSVEGIAHFVDRIALARDFDLAQSASLVVKHQEFGPLTVTFDHARSGLDVQVAAQDAETQRALASAMSGDRNLARPADAHTSVQASHSASAGGERHPGASGQGFAPGGGNAQGERPASQSFGQAAQQGRRPGTHGQPSHRAGSRPSADDDALYA